MAEAARSRAKRVSDIDSGRTAPRHSAVVRVTHWIAALCVLALLLSGGEILISHPRFYWGESGNVLTTPLFRLPIPASRVMVPTGYGYVLPDQNGWSRALHFEAAWVVAFTGVVYIVAGLVTRHFRRNLLPGAGEFSWEAFAAVIGRHLRLRRPPEDEMRSYNPVQKVTYLAVIAILFPLAMWTGLAMSPAFVSVVPASASWLGGQQSARTIHFFVSLALLTFLAIHVAMVFLAGFRNRMRGMITGRVTLRGGER